MGYWCYWKNNTKKLLINISWWFFWIFICGILPLLCIISILFFTENILIPAFGKFIGILICLIIFLIFCTLFLFFLSYTVYIIEKNKGGTLAEKKRKLKNNLSWNLLNNHRNRLMKLFFLKNLKILFLLRLNLVFGKKLKSRR